MSELFPQLVAYTKSAVSPDSLAPDTRRILVSTRAFTGGVYNNQMAQGAFPAAKISHRFFFNGSNWDLSQGATNSSFSVQNTTGTFLIYGITLEMITPKNAVLNGASFGGQYQGGLLGGTTITPGALSNGLLLTVTAAGVSTQIANLQVNEDFALGQYPIAGGPLTGGVYTFRARYEMRQPLASGTTDAVTWQVRDDLSSRGISELRAIAYGATV